MSVVSSMKCLLMVLLCQGFSQTGVHAFLSPSLAWILIYGCEDCYLLEKSMSLQYKGTTVGLVGLIHNKDSVGPWGTKKAISG